MYEQRVRFILEVQQGTFSFAESCRRYGISRTAGYTWFLAEGIEGLHDRSHQPPSLLILARMLPTRRQ